MRLFEHPDREWERRQLSIEDELLREERRELFARHSSADDRYDPPPDDDRRDARHEPLAGPAPDISDEEWARLTEGLDL